MAVGVLGALAQDDLKRLLSFHIVGQIGYMIFGLGLVHGGRHQRRRVLHRPDDPREDQPVPRGRAHRPAHRVRAASRAWAAWSAARRSSRCFFAVPALSLAGLPPSSGFAGKFALIDAGVASSQWAIVTVALVVSLLTLFSMTKIWAGVFWGEPESAPPLEEGRTNGGPSLMVFATGLTRCAVDCVRRVRRPDLRVRRAGRHRPHEPGGLHRGRARRWDR